MENVTIDKLVFKPFLSESVIEERIAQLAKVINADYQGLNPIFLSVLNGSFFFTAELLKHCNFDYEISFVKVKSYDGTSSTNKVKQLFGLDAPVQNRHVVILEDIVESGLTTNFLIEQLKVQQPASVNISTLLCKPNKLHFKALPVKYVGFNIENEFVIGYGLDYNQKARNLRSIYQLKE